MVQTDLLFRGIELNLSHQVIGHTLELLLELAHSVCQRRMMQYTLCDELSSVGIGFKMNGYVLVLGKSVIQTLLKDCCSGPQNPSFAISRLQPHHMSGPKRCKFAFIGFNPSNLRAAAYGWSRNA